MWILCNEVIATENDIALIFPEDKPITLVVGIIDVHNES